MNKKNDRLGIRSRIDWSKCSAVVLMFAVLTGCQSKGPWYSKSNLNPFQSRTDQSDSGNSERGLDSGNARAHGGSNASGALQTSRIETAANTALNSNAHIPNQAVSTPFDSRIPSVLPTLPNNGNRTRLAANYQSARQERGHRYPPQPASSQQNQRQRHSPESDQNILRQQPIPQLNSTNQHQTAPQGSDFRSEESSGWIPQTASEMVVALSVEVRNMREDMLVLKNTVEFVGNENSKLRRERDILHDRINNLEHMLNATRNAEIEMRGELGALQKYMTDFSNKRQQQIRALTKIVDLLEKQLLEERNVSIGGTHAGLATGPQE